MDLQIKGKTALVLGGSKGIGRGIADALAQEGVAVALVARSQETLDKSVGEINATGARAIGVAGDLADWPSMEKAIASARNQLGPIDILINNSGGPPPSGVVGVSPELWTAQFNAMVLSLFRTTDLLLPEMRARKWGRIMTVASFSVIEPIPTIGISNTLRSAIVGWAKTLAGEVARDGITVNTLLPGVIATDRSLSLSRARAERDKIPLEEAIRRNAQGIPVGRLGTIAEFGAVAAFLASPLAAYVTGSMIRIDGGLTRSV
ncbi:MAG: SDR family oxidoreductase [Candidatus Binatus sp.]|uniref:SDR family oxidoreductase n=1 Tax=Candidatus Binatus sp. TaxID=2811406 RepID=UPI002720691B|nr:SDR family oxidoreductase [Candidatus Binatus sp.]MDO8434166.1 SDR family oxidoreductase [Candidatus Binatus sp.]